MIIRSVMLNVTMVTIPLVTSLLHTFAVYPPNVFSGLIVHQSINACSRLVGIFISLMIPYQILKKNKRSYGP